jgi:hypothetical protein
MSYELENITEGVTSEFYWYELKLAKTKLQEVQTTLEKIIHVIEARQAEQSDYVIHLKSKIDKLQVQLNTLRKD